LLIASSLIVVVVVDTKGIRYATIAKYIITTYQKVSHIVVFENGKCFFFLMIYIYMT